MALRFQTKLSVPASAGPLIERAEILERLDQAVESRQVVVLAALAGWGKTTVLAQWAANASLPVAWYSLDRGDCDPHRFLDYLLHAVQKCVPAASELIAQLDGTSPQGLADLYQAAALTIAAGSCPFALILDDYQVLEDDDVPPLPGTELIFELLVRLAEYAPNCHLVLASRMLPKLHGLARMIAQRRATFFDYNVLQWSKDEVQRLAIYSGLSISPEQATDLVSQMGGWVTGIVLSIDSATNSTSNDHSLMSQRPALIARTNPDEVYAFFAEQIIAPLPPALQIFLEDTSILEDLSTQHCNRLRIASDSAEYLAEIVRRGLFIAQRGTKLTYHSLFRAFLRARLARDAGRERVLLQRAATMYRAEDEIDRALDCLLEADDLEQAIELLNNAVPRLRQRSCQSTLLACFERLAAFLDASGRGHMLPPELLLAQVRVYNDLALWEEAKLAAQIAETIGDEQIVWEATILQAEIAMLQGHLDEARTGLDTLESHLLPDHLRLKLHLTLGRVLILLDKANEAIGVFETAQVLAPDAVDAAHLPHQLASIADNLGWAYAEQGERRQALRALKRADACWQASGNHARRPATLNNLGMLALEVGHLAEARRAFENGLALARRHGRRREEILLDQNLGDLHVAEGELHQALACFRAARELAMQIDVPSSVESATTSALWVAVLLNDCTELRYWQGVLADAPPASHSEVGARRALAQALLLLNAEPEHPQLDSLLSLISDADYRQFLPCEQTSIHLIKAARVFNQHGWSSAEPLWKTFEQHAESLPETLQLSLCRLSTRLFQIAAASSAFAQRLMKAAPPALTVRWHITTLGNFACIADRNAIELSPLHRTILVRLLDAGEAGLTVDRLWEDVWGDTDTRMTALHKALARLREQTGIPMAARAGHCALQMNWERIYYDAREFERTVTTARSQSELEHALDLYNGDFLPGAALGAALWVDRRRMLLQQRYLDGMESLAQLTENEQPRQAIQHYQHILEIDGCREETATHLMRLAARQRNHALVNATFDQLAGSLRTLGATPEPETVALLQALNSP